MQDEGDGRIVRDLLARGSSGVMVNYRILVKTGTIRGAGTDANVYLTLFGGKDGADSGAFWCIFSVFCNFPFR